MGKSIDNEVEIQKFCKKEGIINNPDKIDLPSVGRAKLDFIVNVQKDYAEQIKEEIEEGADIEQVLALRTAQQVFAILLNDLNELVAVASTDELMLGLAAGVMIIWLMMSVEISLPVRALRWVMS